MAFARQEGGPRSLPRVEIQTRNGKPIGGRWIMPEAPLNAEPIRQIPIADAPSLTPERITKPKPKKQKRYVNHRGLRRG